MTQPRPIIYYLYIEYTLDLLQIPCIWRNYFSPFDCVLLVNHIKFPLVFSSILHEPSPFILFGYNIDLYAHEEHYINYSTCSLYTFWTVKWPILLALASIFKSFPRVGLMTTAYIFIFIVLSYWTPVRTDATTTIATTKRCKFVSVVIALSLIHRMPIQEKMKNNNARCWKFVYLIK